MTSIPVDSSLVAYCGLYCGACPRLLKGRCPGCHENHKATWCKIRTCCVEHGYASCAECGEHPDPRTCGMFHNLFSRVIGVLLRSDRAACIAQIQREGLEGHAQAMAQLGRPSLRPGGRAR